MFDVVLRHQPISNVALMCAASRLRGRLGEMGRAGRWAPLMSPGAGWARPSSFTSLRPTSRPAHRPGVGARAFGDTLSSGYLGTAWYKVLAPVLAPLQKKPLSVDVSPCMRRPKVRLGICHSEVKGEGFAPQIPEDMSGGRCPASPSHANAKNSTEAITKASTPTHRKEPPWAN